MITIGRARGNTARRVAIGIVVAGLLGVAVPARADTTPADRSGIVHLETPDGGELEYPNPQYPNHEPLRGNYPGSYSAATPTPTHGNGFDWLAAGAGAAGTLGLVLLLTAGRAATRIARGRRHGIPFVVDVRDDG
jgi:hypothetical protein